MRRRQRRNVKAFVISLLAASGIAFIFNDGPEFSEDSHIQWEPLAQASESVNALWQEAASPLKTVTDAPLNLPPHYLATWKQTSLDQGKMKLRVLAKPFALGQTQEGLGSEYFTYAAYLFQQMSEQVQSPSLSTQLRILSVQSQSLGSILAQAAQTRYDAAPLRNMKHLQIQGNLRSLLSAVTIEPIAHTTYSDQGKLIETSPAEAPKLGSSLQTFIATAQQIQEDPNLAEYPQTKAILQAQSAWLQQIAQHIVIKSDSTRHCGKTCSTLTTHIRIYAKQTLSKDSTPQLIVSRLPN